MKLLIIIFFGTYFISTNAQDLEAKLTDSLSLAAETFVGIDDLKNLYYINDNTLFRKNKQESVSYTNLSLGKITSVEIQNPFKIVVFYSDYNAAIILDDKLNELSYKIDFTQNTYFNNVILLSHSSENNLWLYADDNKFHLYDFRYLSEKLQTQPITFYQQDFIPISMKSTYKNAWIMGNNGVIQINQYGNFINFYESSDGLFIFPYLKGFILVKEDSFEYVVDNITTLIDISLNHTMQNIYIKNASIYIFDGIKVYEYNIL